MATGLFGNVLNAISNPVGAASNYIGGLFAPHPSNSGGGSPVPQNTLDTINKATGFTPFVPSSSGGASGGGGGGAAPTAAAGPDYAAQLRQLQQEIAAFQQTPRAANVDYNAISAKARSQAEAAVNPLYTQKLNDFLARQQVEQARKQQDVALSNQQIDEALKNTQEANAVTGERTAADVATNLGQLGNQEQNFQTTEGTNFEGARTALQSGLADSGLTGSGLGAQKENAAITARNQASGQQVQSFNLQKKAQNDLKTRTFEDLARSGAIAEKTAGTGKSQNAIDLNRFIEDQAYNEKATRASLEAQRLSDVIAQQGQYGKIGFQEYLNSLTNPGVREATAKAYGGLF